MTTSRGTLRELFSGRNNSIGFIRLLLALAVVLSHSRPLGFGQADLGHYLFGKQTNVGNLAVYGFFVLSGLLITRSARRTSLVRYAWHRALRILPGLWVCLLISALVVAPLITLREHGTLAGFWDGPGGPLQYITANWWTGLRQFGVHDLFVETTPWGRHTGASVFDGAIWSLSYEMLCYVGIGILAVTGVLRQSRRFVLFTTVAFLGIIAKDYWDSGTRIGPVVEKYNSTVAPLIGGVDYRWVVYLGFLFLLGATFELYSERIHIHDALGVASAVVFIGSLLFGGFYVFGFPAYGYLLIWLGVRLPRIAHRVGQKNDYSYGIYIYGFVGQQVLVSLGYNRWGFIPFVGISVVVAAIAGFLSWHLVEKHAMSLKGWTPRLPRRRATQPAPAAPAAPVAEAAPAAPAAVGDPHAEAGSNTDGITHRDQPNGNGVGPVEALPPTASVAR